MNSIPATHLDRSYREEALSLLYGRGAILDTAREISTLLREAHVSAAVIGGIAVVLHGHWRATKDVDLLVGSNIQEVAELLESNGFQRDVARREFVRDGIPVHLVLPEQTGLAPDQTIEIEGITTVSLADLIAMKLRSGSKNLLRAQDLADVIGLIRRHELSGTFASRLDKSLRPAFRKLVKAIERENKG